MGDNKNIFKNVKEDYQIEISQNGKFDATFDTANLRIKILQNTDYRPSQLNKKKVNSNDKNEFETIAYFKIKDDFTIEKFYITSYMPPPFIPNDDEYTEAEEISLSDLEFCGFKVSVLDEETASSVSNKTTTNNKKKVEQFRWSFDISNMHKNDDKYFVFVAISRINVDEDMKEIKEKDDYVREYLCKKKFIPIDESENTTINISQGSKSEKRIAIYRIELKKKDGNFEEENYILSAVTCYYSSKISGICNFVEVLNKIIQNNHHMILN
ncbi:hypothetical protein C1646_772294 [Rhizophagus diaphanus]|nr:hypothetical protein C1646_772294 [Rhizophagus diaphanus] [Rhizophagus sp. MUCL 43196]